PTVYHTTWYLIPCVYTILYKSAKNWENAQAYCQSLNMDLVMVRSSEENSKLLTLSEKNSAWIGLRLETVSNIWKWVNGEQAQFTNWDSKEPKVHYDKENCATIEQNHQGKWSAMPCEEQNPFICSNGTLLLRIKLHPPPPHASR
uniref:C-type lectin domain-containing protein n=1 Tax=Erpetoichthys calabaricus TaxID=27687 RepID=A0A8C4REQ1_ERPCA